MADNFNNLHKIDVPVLGQSFGDNIVDTFKNIDANFNILNNKSLTSGDDGLGLLSLKIKISDLVGEDNIEREINTIVYTIHSQRDNIKQALIELKETTQGTISDDDADVDDILHQLEQDDFDVLVNIKESKESVETNILSVTPFVIIDKRFQNIDNVRNISTNRDGDVIDMSCILCVSESENEEGDEVWKSLRCFPTIKYDRSKQDFYWIIYGNETGIKVSGEPGRAGEDGSTLKYGAFIWDESTSGNFPPQSATTVTISYLVGSDGNYVIVNEQNLEESDFILLHPVKMQGGSPVREDFSHYYVSSVLKDNTTFKAYIGPTYALFADLNGVQLDELLKTIGTEGAPDGLYIPVTITDGEVTERWIFEKLDNDDAKISFQRKQNNSWVDDNSHSITINNNILSSGVISNIQSNINNLNTNKQDKLISGTNIKTINGNSILGSGNITISAGGGGTGNANWTNNINDGQAQNTTVCLNTYGLRNELGKKQDKLFTKIQDGGIASIPSSSDAQNYANGIDSFAIGTNAHATGERSFASGATTNASGTCSHAEGSGTTASGTCSHAEGSSTTANGSRSHAEGYLSIAGGDYSHAEGYQTEANGNYSHAEGYQTEANGNYSHAEGSGTKALGLYSHAEGYERPSGSQSYWKVVNPQPDATSYTTENIIGFKVGDILRAVETSGTQTIYNYAKVIEITDDHNFKVARTLSSSGNINSNVIRVYYGFAYGNYSHAEGNSTASGDYSHAEGYQAMASGAHSHAEGRLSQALGNNSHAEGYQVMASGDYSHVEGRLSQALGEYSHAEGYKTTAEGKFSHAEGSNTIASDQCAHAEGTNTIASSWYSHAEGCETIAEHLYSHASGLGTKTSNAGDFVIGQYNAIGTSRRFEIGGGSSDSNRKTIFYVDSNGDTFAKSFNQTGSDYAEYFEWADGNPNNEDRIGRFVVLEDDKIRLANKDEEPIGIISGISGVIGNTAEDYWSKKYLTDIFGRPVYEDVEIELPDGTKVTEKHQKLNPDYDPNKEYIPRSQRPEWDVVGLLGQLIVIDNGKCVPGQRCGVGKDGIAVPGDKYRVMKRLDKKHIKILASFI